MRSVEVLLRPGSRPDVERLLSAVSNAALANGAVVSATQDYFGKSEWLVVYGPGAEQNRDAMSRQLAAGRRTLAFDLGYWDRYSFSRMWRIAVDGAHPTPTQLRATLTLGNKPRISRNVLRRFRREHPRARSGKVERVLLVGLGAKSRAALGLSLHEWERAAVTDIRAAWPTAVIVHRTKPGTCEDAVLPGTVPAGKEGIDNVLLGVDHVVCRHSNVAVDAAFAGLSCQTEGGIGAALYPRTYAPVPSMHARMGFLERVSWWQWSRHELHEALKFVATIQRSE